VVVNCDGKLASCGPAAARWSHRNGNISRLCRACLDHWFDNADDDPDLEPVAWQWLEVTA
jgi:hypothetical protein